jgi:hypothetical protein
MLFKEPFKICQFFNVEAMKLDFIRNELLLEILKIISLPAISSVKPSIEKSFNSVSLTLEPLMKHFIKYSHFDQTVEMTLETFRISLFAQINFF